MDYKISKHLNANKLEDNTKVLNHPPVQESRTKCILPVCLGRVLTILYTYLSSI